MTQEEYTANRRRGIAEAIKRAGGSRKRLEGLRKSRLGLALIYEEDGARVTADCIRRIDIAAIDAAIAGLPA